MFLNISSSSVSTMNELEKALCKVSGFYEPVGPVSDYIGDALLGLVLPDLDDVERRWTAMKLFWGKCGEINASRIKPADYSRIMEVVNPPNIKWHIKLVRECMRNGDGRDGVDWLIVKVLSDTLKTTTYHTANQMHAMMCALTGCQCGSDADAMYDAHKCSNSPRHNGIPTNGRYILFMCIMVSRTAAIDSPITPIEFINHWFPVSLGSIRSCVFASELDLTDYAIRTGHSDWDKIFDDYKHKLLEDDKKRIEDRKKYADRVGMSIINSIKYSDNKELSDYQKWSEGVPYKIALIIKTGTSKFPTYIGFVGAAVQVARGYSIQTTAIYSLTVVAVTYLIILIGTAYKLHNQYKKYDKEDVLGKMNAQAIQYVDSIC